MISSHPALAARRVAVVTGAASGIGLAAAKRFAAFGMRLCIADVSEERLADAARVLEPLLAPLSALAFAARRGVEAAAVATAHPALLTVVARPGDTVRQEPHPDAVD